MNKSTPRFREWCILVSAELSLDGGQSVLTLPELSLRQAVSILRAQGVTQLFKGLEVLPGLGEAGVLGNTGLRDGDGAEGNCEQDGSTDKSSKNTICHFVF